MSLPQQEIKDSYSYDEVQHMIAREWAKGEIQSNKNGLFKLQQQVVEFMATAQADSKALRDLLAGFPVLVANQIDASRKDMRREIQNDFPDKLEAERMERRIEDKIGATDKTLGKQIGDLDKKMDASLAELAAQIKDVNTDLAGKIKDVNGKVEKAWLKITVTVTTVIGVGGFITWLISTSRFFAGA